MKKILYIYGYGSDANSSTSANLQSVLGNGFDVRSVNYDQLHPKKAIKQLSEIVDDGNYDAVIGSSLGGYYTLQLKANVKKVVINPCMVPSIELPKLGCDIQTAQKFKEYETYSKADNVLGLFGDHDELIDYKEKFSQEVSRNVHEFSSGHRPTINELREVANVIINFLKD